MTLHLDIRFDRYCQAQGPTPGPTQSEGQGQVRSDSNANSNSKVGPELYTKIGFHHPLTTHTIFKSVFREQNA